MEKLFIIGNGFDLAHDIKSSYDNFRQYLEDKYPNMNRNIHSVPEATLMPDGGEVFDDDEVVGFLINVISNIKGNDWRDFETALGLLEYHDFFDSLYSDFQIERVKAKRMINSSSAKRGELSELLIRNY